MPFDEKRYNKALKEASQLGIDYKCILNKLSLIKIDNEFTKVGLVKEFYLS